MYILYIRVTKIKVI